MKIKDGYIGYSNRGFITFGGFKLVNNKPKQIPFTKREMKQEIKRLEQKGETVTTAEICVYEVENNKDAELIDPIKTETLI